MLVTQNLVLTVVYAKGMESCTAANVNLVTLERTVNVSMS